MRREAAAFQNVLYEADRAALACVFPRKAGTKPDMDAKQPGSVIVRAAFVGSNVDDNRVLMDICQTGLCQDADRDGVKYVLKTPDILSEA